METLLEACGGRAIEAFPQAAWKAILGRISLEEQKGTSNHDLEDGLDGYVEVRGWEETKGDTATEQEEKRAPSAVSNGRSKGRGRGADVALAASSDQQLHIAGTFRRAIRTSVRVSKLLLRREVANTARVVPLELKRASILFGDSGGL